MPSYREDIRLRVELNFRIKFYVKLSSKDTLYDLKKLIDSILKRNYQIKLPHYYIRTADGFEVLELFKIGDILDDNQLILLDSFNMNSNYSNALNLNRIDQSKAEASADEPNSSPSKLIKSKPDGAHGSIISARPGNKAFTKTLKDGSEDIPNIPEQEIPAHYESTRRKTFEPVKGENIKQKADEPVKKDDKKSIVKHVEIESERAAIKKEDMPTEAKMPPKPDNFKGFTVKKADLIKTPGSKFEEEGSFKPLKKRKTEEEPYEIL